MDSDIETASDAERFISRVNASPDHAPSADPEGRTLSAKRLSLAALRSKFTIDDKFAKLGEMVGKAEEDLSKAYFVPPSELQTRAEKLQSSLNDYATTLMRQSPKDAFEQAERILTGRDDSDEDVRSHAAPVAEGRQIHHTDASPRSLPAPADTKGHCRTRRRTGHCEAAPDGSGEPCARPLPCLRAPRAPSPSRPRTVQ